MDATQLPSINAGLNAASAVLLGAGYGAIRSGRRELHQKLMLAATLASAVFLACYLAYHYHVGSVRFTAQGWIRPVYFTILISHIVLAAGILPFILRLLFLSWKERFAEHAVLGRRVFPAWMYVSVTGIAVYLMLYRMSW